MQISKRKGRDATNIFDIFAYTAVTVFALFCLIPFIVILAASFSDETELLKNGYWLWPRDFSTVAYKNIFNGSAEILHSYMSTIIITVFGTVTSVIFTLLLAYPLSRNRYKYKNKINFFIVITLLFNGGMVPWYIVCTKYLGLKNSYASLIIPYLLNAWYVFILKSFLSSIPESIEESARIDGANNFRILFQIIFPLALPGIATIALFISLQYWNDWWLPKMFISGDKIVPLQFYLMRIIRYVEFLQKGMNFENLNGANMPTETLRMALCIIAIGPIVFAYPFFQKYFIKGLTIGAVKG